MVTIRRTGGRTEHYTLNVKRTGVAIEASDGAGEMDALATLAQLIGPAGAIPCVHIVDHPALAFRWVSDDVSRGTLPTMKYFAARIRRLASYKLNGYSPYLENVVIRPGHETETRADGITKDELKQLSTLAARYHMAFVPEQETFSHMGAVLSSPEYADVRENPYTELISPASPRTYDVLRDLLSSEFSGVPGIHYIHIGGDETFELGTGRSRALVRSRGYAAVYGGHINRVARMVKSMGARPLIWGDAVQKYPKILRYIPRTTIVVPFDYAVEPSYDGFIAPITRAGFDLLVAPSVSNFSQFFPDIPKATGNIAAFVRDAKRQKALGMFLTVWIGERDELYEATWYPLAFGAAHAWESANQNPDEFCARFAAVTFGAASSCAPFKDLAELDDTFRQSFRFDSPETLLRADWRVPYLSARLHLAPTRYAQVASLVVALRHDVAALDARRDAHQVNAMKVAANRYAILVRLMGGEHPSSEIIRSSETLHLAEWRYENRPLSATDQIAERYQALLPHTPPARSSFPLPTIADPAVSGDLQGAASWLVQHDSLAAAPDFLFTDRVPYIAKARGIDPAQVTPEFDRVNSHMAQSSDPAVHVTVRYLSAKLRAAELPFVIQRDYEILQKTHDQVTVGMRVGHILSELGTHEADISALEDSYRELPTHSSSVLDALDLERAQIRAMEGCFQTYVHEWMTYGGAPSAAADDRRAHLPANVAAVFCRP